MKNVTFRLTGNQLKLIALIAMTFDHVGVQLFPQITVLRIIGRLAFPIFAYMIAEGCRYTRDRRKYLLLIVFVALVCQVVYFTAMHSLYMCIMVTFSLSISLIFVSDKAVSEKKMIWIIAAAFSYGVVAFICEWLPLILSNTDFAVDYGFYGVILPIVVFFGKTQRQKLFFTALVLILLAVNMGGVQWCGLLSLLPLALYNGSRGKHKLKNFFYIYYPLHLGVIYFISLCI